MIPAAALLVLVGLGLFIGGIVTGATVFYWACVGACVLAGVFLVLARVRMGRTPAPAPDAPVGRTPAPPPPTSTAELAAAPVGDPAAPPVAEPPSTGSHALRPAAGSADPHGDPPVEEVEVTDLLLVVDLRDDVLVVDEHPRYHLARCRWLAGRETIPLPLDEARTDGFTPCGWCEPDRTLAEGERARRAGRGR